jgi:hypothetical protein
MRRLQVSFVVSLVFLVSCASGVDATPPSCFLADFDQDDDLWTIETACEEESCELTFILEVPPDPPLDRWFQIDIAAGCCEFDEIGHYGAWVDVDANLELVDDYEKIYTTCLCCSSWYLRGHIRSDVELLPGERYVLAQGNAHAICDDEQPCPPTHDFTADFALEQGTECEPNEIYMTLACSTTGVSVDDGLTCSGEILGRPHPNPVQAALHVPVNLPEPGRAQVRVVDVSGRILATIVDGELPSGPRTVSYDFLEDGRDRLASGIYFVRMDAPGVRQSRMFVVNR